MESELLATIIASAPTAVEAAKAIAKARHKGDLQLAGNTTDIEELREIRGSQEVERLSKYAKSSKERRWIRMASTSEII